LEELKNEKFIDLNDKEELLNTSKELREFKPDLKTIEEYDELINQKMMKQYPDLFKNVD
jgi:hypothetical protein